MTIIDEACYERGCACHDSREGSGIEVFAGDGGYGIGTREAYEEFVKLRNYPIPPKQEEQTMDKALIKRLAEEADVWANYQWPKPKDRDFWQECRDEKFVELIIDHIDQQGE
jgi:hypothetical protein